MGKGKEGQIIMSDFIIKLILSSFIMTIAAFTYKTVTPQLEKRYPAKIRFIPWLVILLGLAIPYRPYICLFTEKLSIAFNLLERIKTGADGFNNYGLIQVLPEAHVIKLEYALFAIWLTGAACFLLNRFIQHFSFIKLIKRWREDITEVEILNVIYEAERDIGINNKVKYQICPILTSPALIGLFKPVVLLPNLTPDADTVKIFISHELIHYKRRDLWSKLLLLIASSVHWFNPFMGFISKEVLLQTEIACDEETLKFAVKEERVRYLESLALIAQYGLRFKSELSTCFNGGVKDMKKRAERIMDAAKKKKGFVAIFLTVGIIIALSLVFVNLFNNTHVRDDENLSFNEAYDISELSSDEKQSLMRNVKEKNLSENLLIFSGVEEANVWLTETGENCTANVILNVNNDFDKEAELEKIKVFISKSVQNLNEVNIELTDK